MTKSVDPKKFTSNPGSPIHELFSGKVESDGQVTLVKVGEENTDDLINAAKDSCDISVILSYYNQTGDEKVLNRYIPHYGDFANLPKSLAEFLQLRIDSQNFFDALPQETRELFDNDSNKFFAQAGEDSWFEKLKPVVDPEPKIIDPDKEVNSSES